MYKRVQYICKGNYKTTVKHMNAPVLERCEKAKCVNVIGKQGRAVCFTRVLM